MKSFSYKDERGRLDIFEEDINDVKISSFRMSKPWKLILQKKGELFIPLGFALVFTNWKLKLVKLGDGIVDKSLIFALDYGIMTDSKKNNDVLVRYDNLFKVNRVYILSDSSPDIIRGAHAHKNLSQIFFVTGHQVMMRIIDDTGERLCNLNPATPFYMSRGKWRELVFRNNVDKVVVLASQKYEESDYIREMVEFKEYLKTIH